MFRSLYSTFCLEMWYFGIPTPLKSKKGYFEDWVWKKGCCTPKRRQAYLANLDFLKTIYVRCKNFLVIMWVPITDQWYLPLSQLAPIKANFILCNPTFSISSFLNSEGRLTTDSNLAFYAVFTFPNNGEI